MTRKATICLLAVLCATVSGAARADDAVVAASVTVNPLDLSLSLSTLEGKAGDRVRARAAATNLGSAELSTVRLTLRADPSGLTIIGKNPRTIDALAGGASAEVAWQLCGREQASYVVLVRGTTGGFSAESAAQLLRITGIGRCPRA